MHEVQNFKLHIHKINKKHHHPTTLYSNCVIALILVLDNTGAASKSPDSRQTLKPPRTARLQSSLQNDLCIEVNASRSKVAPK